MVSQVTPYIYLAVGLLVGLLLLPSVKLLAASGIGGIFEAFMELLAAPYRMLRSLLQRSGELRSSGKKLKSAVLRTNPHMEQIKASSQVLRNILMELTVVIQRTDQAASTSNQTLDEVRTTIGRMELPRDLAAVHHQLLREIDRMISGNTALKRELSSTKDVLASQRQQIEELRSAVRLDGLTQLANRAYFDERLAESVKLRKRSNDSFSVLMIDVDNFKNVNDQYGHQAGDRVLKGVAFNLRKAVRDSDFVARFGGDEFAVLLFRSSGPAAIEVAQKICQAQRESRFVLDGSNINVTLSIGVAEGTADDTAETILKRADQALYQVKEAGRDGVR